MNLKNLLDERLIKFDFEASSREDAIRKVAQLLFEAGKITDYDQYLEGVFKREEIASTGIGMGIAIPHCQDETVNEVAFTLVKLRDELEWESLDEKPVTLVAMLAAPLNGENLHLKMLSKLAILLMEDEFREGLLSANSMNEIELLFEKFQTERE